MPRAAKTATPAPEEEIASTEPTIGDAVGQPSSVLAAIQMFDEGFEKLNLVQKIAHISGYLGAVPKRGYNAFHKYNYVTEADVVTIVRQYLSAAGIVIIPNTTTVTREGDLTIVVVAYTVTDGIDSFTFHTPGYGSDRGDKGVYKALTGSQKYAIMKLFKIDTGDDPEQDTRVDERAAQTEARPVTVRSGDRTGVQRGGHTDNASAIQVRRINELTRDLDLERSELVDLVSVVTSKEFILPSEEAAQGPAVLSFIRSLTGEQAGLVIEAMVERVSDRLAGQTDSVADTGPYG